MVYYFIPVIWIGTMFLLTQISKLKTYNTIDTEKHQHPSFLYAFLTLAPLIIMTTIRAEWIGDTGVYKIIYNKLPTSYNSIIDYLLHKEKDPTFYAFTIAFKLITGAHYRVWFLTLALYHSLVLIWLDRKYSDNYLLSVLLFIVSTDYLSWMFNGIRQFTAVCIVLMATDFFINKKYLQSFLFILIASLFHQSALIMIPLVLISQGKAWNKKTIFFIIITFIVVYFVDSFTDILDNSLTETNYGTTVSRYKNGAFEDDGTHPLRVLVYSVPAILSFFVRDKIKSEGSDIINFSANMSIMSAGLYLISMVTSGIYVGRLPIYCSLYSYVLLPWEIEHLFSEGASRRIVYIAMIVLYIGFYWYSMRMLLASM